MAFFTKTNIRFFTISVLMCLQSCQYFEKPQAREKLLQKELDAINWNKVDEFPTMADCEILDTQEQQMQCLFDFVSADIKKRIKNHLIINPSATSTISVKDTIFVKVIILPTSELIFITERSTNYLYENSQIDSILKLDTLKMPKVKPASKRGILVKSAFVVPVIL